MPARAPVGSTPISRGVGVAIRSTSCSTAASCAATDGSSAICSGRTERRSTSRALSPLASVTVTRCIASDAPPGIGSTASMDRAPDTAATHANASASGAARCNARVTSPSWRLSARDSIASTVFGRHLAATNSTYRPSTSARSGGPTTTSNDDIPTIPDQPRELLPEKHTKPHRLPEYLQIGAQNQPAALAASSPPGAVSMRLSWRPSTARPVGAPSGDNSISAHRGSSSATSK